MSPLPWPPRIAAPRRRVPVFLLPLVIVSLAGCAALSGSEPAATPADFQVIGGEFVQRGLTFDHIVSGDAGCNDVNLARTAIGLDARGLDQATPTRLYIYLFRDQATFERLRQSVDTCAGSYATDPGTFESVEASPFVVAGPGPWAPQFRAAIRAAITEAAGTGG
jgi:hypothetical protein